MTSAVILQDRGVLSVSGTDWRDFLQNLVSNDLDNLSPDQAVYAALLTPQGKYLFDFIMLETDDGVLLDTGAERLPDLLRRLMMYKLRADVLLADASDDWQVAALYDTGTDVPPVDGVTEREGALIYSDPREAALGQRALLPRGMSLADIGCEAGDLDAYENRRVALAVPNGTVDLIVDKTLLMEANFERLNGVSFTKGCYIGQELTARTKHRGNVRRRLYPVSIDTDVQPGTPVTLEGKPIGDVRSVAGHRAIAMLRIEDVNRAAEEGLLMVAGSGGLKVEHPVS
ncbi:MAG: YgfZ/GcvT domain-containing protein [Alphaproteobacteria bacterium]